MQTIERSSKYNWSIFQKVLDNVLGTENGVTENGIEGSVFIWPENSLRGRKQ